MGLQRFEFPADGYNERGVDPEQKRHAAENLGTITVRRITLRFCARLFAKSFAPDAERALRHQPEACRQAAEARSLLRTHLATFLDDYNFAKRLKVPRGL